MAKLSRNPVGDENRFPGVGRCMWCSVIRKGDYWNQRTSFGRQDFVPDTSDGVTRSDPLDFWLGKLFAVFFLSAGRYIIKINQKVLSRGRREVWDSVPPEERPFSECALLLEAKPYFACEWNWRDWLLGDASTPQFCGMGKVAKINKFQWISFWFAIIHWLAIK